MNKTLIAIGALAPLTLCTSNVFGHSMWSGDTAKITFNNYFHSQYRDTNQAGNQQHSFEVRRLRLSMTMEVNERSSVKAGFDLASGTNRSSSELKDMALVHKPIGTEELTVTAGQFGLPVSAETQISSSVIEFPEKVTFSRAMLSDKRVRGLMVEKSLEGGLTIYGGLSNSLTTKDPEQASLAPGPGGRLAGFGGVKLKRDEVQLGVGYFAGERPEFVGGGTSPAIDRRFLFLDAEVTNLVVPGLYVRSELMLGHDRVPSSTGAPGNVAHDMNGHSTTLGFKAKDGLELFTRLSVFDPNDSLDGDSVTEYGFGVRRGLGAGVSLSLAYEVFRDPSVANSPYGVTTLRTQLKF